MRPPADLENTRYLQSYVNFMSQAVYWWVTDLLIKGFKHPLTLKDLGKLPQVCLKVEVNFKSLQTPTLKNVGVLSQVCYKGVSSPFKSPLTLKHLEKFLKCHEDEVSFKSLVWKDNLQCTPDTSIVGPVSPSVIVLVLCWLTWSS